MKIISFAETAVALMAGRKTCTRRVWTDRRAAGFHLGDIVQAYDRSPRHGGKRVCLIRLTAALELTDALPESDWEAEGFAYMTEHGLTLWGLTPTQVWQGWLLPPRRAWWVVRFELA